MPERLLRFLVDHLRAAAGPPAESWPSDGELLDRFLRDRDQIAFELLVRRHGTLVLGVCRRVLHDAHAAEDAFQATFLVLARKARFIRQRTVAGWLYRVALRTALRAQRGAARRACREQPLVAEPAVEEPDRLAGADLRAVLDGELARLPEKLRLPVLLCYVEGHTAAQAAGLLGCPRGTVLSRLATARQRLRARLARRGVELPAIGLAVGVGAGPVSAAVPARLVALATEKVLVFSAGKVGAAGVASTPAVHLAEGALRAMLMSKLIYALGAVLTVGALATAVGWVTSIPPAGVSSQAQSVTTSDADRAKADAKDEKGQEAQLQKARKDWQVLEGELSAAEEQLSRQLVEARQELLVLEEEIRAVERRRNAELALHRRRMQQPETPEVAALRKVVADLTGRILDLKAAGMRPQEEVLNRLQEQLAKHQAQLQDQLANAEKRRAMHEDQALRLEQDCDRQLELRKEVVAKEESIRRLERQADRAIARRQAEAEAAVARLRQLEGLPALQPPSIRSNLELERKLDELLREVADLRRELKRQREGKGP